MVKIDIISGFLGAGKTTLIRKLFKSSLKNEKKVLIENEFGEISVDGAFLKDSGVEIKEINAGCICCSLVGDFKKSIQEVVTRFNPDRIIIEPSGVGKLSDIVNAVVSSGLENLKINVLVTVVDGLKANIYLKNFGEFFLDQIEYANTIVISKLDKAKGNKDEIVKLVKAKNDHANIITTPITEINPDTLLSLLEEKASLYNKFVEDALKEAKEHHHHEDEEEEEHEHECHHHHHHGHDADEIFTSWGQETTKAISYDELKTFLDTLTNNDDLGIIVRSKGILKASDNEKWYYFDYVSGDYEIRLGEPDFTGRIVVIGSKIDEDKIKHLFFKD